MRIEKTPHYSIPTIAVLPYRRFHIGWTWYLRALKLFPSGELIWTHHFVDNGEGHARSSVFQTYGEAVKAADTFNVLHPERVRQAEASSELAASTILKVGKALTAGRRLRDEEELMEQEAIRRNAHLPRPAAHELQLTSPHERLRNDLAEQLAEAPYLRIVAFPRFRTSLRLTDNLTWEPAGTLNSKLSQLCYRERIARGFGLSGGNHWGRTKAHIRAELLPRANQLLQIAGVKRMLAEARARGQRVLVIGSFVFWYEEDASPRWVVKNAGSGSAGSESETLWHEGTILSRNHGRIVVLPYVKENGERVQGHTKNAPQDGKALPRHPDDYVELPFEVLEGDLMIGLFGELSYE
ncbi:hypothetical protein SHV74_11265 [Pseudomonas capeferrum]|uniref:hypothetical protein n=1 Tax=Pseudomonas capeferrum TaxID=1495066 RepID=UPI00397C4DFF